MWPREYRRVSGQASECIIPYEELGGGCTLIGPTCDVARWQVPTIVAWGEKDKYLPPSEATTFAASNPEYVTAAILEGAGHMPQEDW